MNNSQKGSALLVILILIAVLVIGTGAYVYIQNKQSGATAGNIGAQTISEIKNNLSGVVASPETTTVVKQAPVDVHPKIQNTSAKLALDLAVYHVGCMVKDCKSNYTPISIQHLALQSTDSFGTAPDYEKGTLFELVSFDSTKIVVKLAKFVSPLINHTRVKVGSDSTFSFSTSACFTLNDWMDDVPSFCLARSSANANLSFDIISNVAP